MPVGVLVLVSDEGVILLFFPAKALHELHSAKTFRSMTHKEISVLAVTHIELPEAPAEVTIVEEVNGNKEKRDKKHAVVKIGHHEDPAHEIN